MGQYDILTALSSSDIILSDTIGTYRLQSRTGILWVDKELTSLGFDGVENTDWQSVYAYSHPSSSIDNFRVGARDLHWRVDQALTPLGFGGGGVENTDWANIDKFKLS